MKLRYQPLDARRFEGETDGARTRLITLRNSRGMCLSFTNLGGKILQLAVPDCHGDLDDVVLGYDCIEDVRRGQPSMGAFVGRFANRIARGCFTLDGREYRVETNACGHLLHGGARGSLHRVFDVAQIDEATAHLRLYYRSSDDGFPGNLMSRVIYRVTEANELRIAYDAVTDSPTVVNMTSHAFFNLAGHDQANEASLARHELTIQALYYTPVTREQIPTGALLPVAGTALDFTCPHVIGERVHEAARLEPRVGYDHNWVIAKRAGQFGQCARLREPVSGRTMDVLSTEPGLVFYGGNNLAGESPRDRGKQGLRYERRSALCLEPARFPDAPNHPQFPNTVLRPGEWFSGRTVYRFGVA